MIDRADELLLEHFGTKGMRWGVRKNAARADKKWAKNVYSIKGSIDVHNKFADKMNNGALAKLNAAHPKAHLDHDTPATRAYIKAYEDLARKLTVESIQEVHGVSPTGGYKATLGFKNGTHQIVIEATEVQHAGNFEWETLVIPLEDDGQYITGTLKINSKELQQSNLVESLLEHHGVKGMRWGTRKAKGQSASDFKKTVGLRKRKPHELSNKQLQTVNARINLEQNYRRLNPTKLKSGAATARALLATLTTAASAYGLYKSPAGQAAVSLGKKFLEKKL